jgi:hypothetical protein
MCILNHQIYVGKILNMRYLILYTSENMKIFQYLRCPVCGKLSRARNYHSSLNHKIEIKEQEIGGKKHIKWFSKDVNRDILFMLYMKIKAVCNRLEWLLGIQDIEIKARTKPRIKPRTMDTMINDIRITANKVVIE